MQDERNRASEVAEKELRETLEKLLQQGDPERLIEAVVVSRAMSPSKRTRTRSSIGLQGGQVS